MPIGAPLVVAGAGIAGLGLAAALRRDGSDCLLLDERPELGSSGGAITLWPNALAALDAIGVGDDVRRAGTPVAAGTIRDPAGRVLRSLDGDRFRAALGEPMVAIRRGVLVELLHARVAPDSVRAGVAVRGYRREGDGVCVLTDGEPLRAVALVGADGYRSAVARALEADLPERYAGYPAWRGVADLGGLAPEQFWGRHREFGVVPLDAGSTYWFAAAREPAGGSAADELAHLREVFADWPSPVRALLDATAPDAVTRNDVMDRGTPRRWADGPVVLLGDAAHAMRPHLGQGGAQALVDAVVLARCLREHPDAAAAFAAYERARRRPALRVVRLSRAAGFAVSAPTLLHHALQLVPERLLLARLASFGGP
jgi:2-polyprenyl-6-methoxyphenol hydroxylase-like FAD-dependent oxidoreductase